MAQVRYLPLLSLCLIFSCYDVNREHHHVRDIGRSYQSVWKWTHNTTSSTTKTAFYHERENSNSSNWTMVHARLGLSGQLLYCKCTVHVDIRAATRLAARGGETPHNNDYAMMTNEHLFYKSKMSSIFWSNIHISADQRQKL